MKIKGGFKWFATFKVVIDKFYERLLSSSLTCMLKSDIYLVLNVSYRILKSSAR